jgi:hypothetical protein
MDAKMEKLNKSKHKDGNTNTNIIISFYPNTINITFSQEELILLNKGLKYNVHF